MTSVDNPKRREASAILNGTDEDLRKEKKGSNKMKYERKTKDEISIESYYGRWEEVTIEDNMEEAREMLKCYKENQPNVPHRISIKRIKIERE